MTWLDIDTLDLKYHKGQVWRISDTCYVYDVQAGDILDVPFVVSDEYQDVLIGYNLTGVTLEQVLGRKALWVQKQYATFYEALNEFGKLGAGLLEHINKHQVRVNVTGRVMLVRQSEMRQQKFLQLAQNNPMQAMQYLLHRIQTESTAVVPVMRDKVVVPEVPKLPEESRTPLVPGVPKGFDTAVLANYKPLTALSTSVGVFKDSPALKSLLSKLYFEIEEFSTISIQYIYALCSVQVYKQFKEQYPLGDFNQVPFIDPASLLATSRYPGIYNSYSRVFGAGVDLKAYPELTVETVALNAIPEYSDSVIRCPLQETLVGTIYLWLVPNSIDTGISSSIGVAPVHYTYHVGTSPQVLQVSREANWDTNAGKQDYVHALDVTSLGARPVPTGDTGTILEYNGTDTVTYSMYQDGYGDTTVRFKGTQLSSTSGLSDWTTEFDVSKVLPTYTQDIEYSVTDMQLFRDIVHAPISHAYKTMKRVSVSTDSTLSQNSARNGAYIFIDKEYSWIEYPTKVPPDPYPKSSEVKATLSYSGMVTISNYLEFGLLTQYKDESDTLNHINRFLYSTKKDATVRLQYKYIPTFKFNAASLDSLLFRTRGNNGS